MQRTYKTLILISAFACLAATWTTGQVALDKTDIRAGTHAVADIDLTAFDFVLLQVEIKRMPGAGDVSINLYKSTDGVVYDSDPFVVEQPEGDKVWSYYIRSVALPFLRVVIKHDGTEGGIQATVRYSGR